MILHFAIILSVKKRRDKEAPRPRSFIHGAHGRQAQQANRINENVLSQRLSLVDAIGAMAQLVARPPPERKVGSSSLSGLTIFCP